jgi:hypothetical protein
VTTSSLVEEAGTWGIRKRAAAAVIAEMLDRTLAAILEIPGDERVLAAIGKQAEQVRMG